MTRVTLRWPAESETSTIAGGDPDLGVYHGVTLTDLVEINGVPVSVEVLTTLTADSPEGSWYRFRRRPQDRIMTVFVWRPPAWMQRHWERRKQP